MRNSICSFLVKQSIFGLKRNGTNTRKIADKVQSSFVCSIAGISVKRCYESRSLHRARNRQPMTSVICSNSAIVSFTHLKCVSVKSRLVLIQPRLHRISNWRSTDVASIGPLFFDVCRSGYFCRSVSNFMILFGSPNHSVRSPLSILSTIRRILSVPYSPQANSTTAKVENVNCD